MTTIDKIESIDAKMTSFLRRMHRQQIIDTLEFIWNELNDTVMLILNVTDEILKENPVIASVAVNNGDTRVLILALDAERAGGVEYLLQHLFLKVAFRGKRTQMNVPYDSVMRVYAASAPRTMLTVVPPPAGPGEGAAVPNFSHKKREVEPPKSPSTTDKVVPFRK